VRSVLWFGAGEPVRDSCFSHCAVACALAVIDAPAQQYLTTLQTFNGANGSGVSSPLIQGTNGNLYGTSYTEGSPCNGGPGGPGCGTVFQVTPSNVMTTLYVFCSLPNCADGQNPSGAIVQGADGNIYGTTFLGGANNSGTVFQLTPEGVLTTLYSFSGDYRADYGGPGARAACYWARMETFMERPTMSREALTVPSSKSLPRARSRHFGTFTGTRQWAAQSAPWRRILRGISGERQPLRVVGRFSSSPAAVQASRFLSTVLTIFQVAYPPR
jgi:uncharacterized repeat protein (TIGR03803 family)